MKSLLLLMALHQLNCSEAIIDGYDGDKFTLETNEKLVSGTSYIIDTLYFNKQPIYKSTTADGSVAVRFAVNNNVFVSTAENKVDKLIIIGSTNGGSKLVLRLSDSMRYVPVKKDEVKEYIPIINIHFIKLYLSDIK